MVEKPKWRMGIESNGLEHDWEGGPSIWEPATARAVAYCVERTTDLLRVQENTWRGFSYKEGLPLGTLVVKGFVEDEAVVCFISGKGLASCFKIFLRKYEEDRLEWVLDKYG